MIYKPTSHKLKNFTVNRLRRAVALAGMESLESARAPSPKAARALDPEARVLCYTGCSESTQRRLGRGVSLLCHGQQESGNGFSLQVLQENISSVSVTHFSVFAPND